MVNEAGAKYTVDLALPQGEGWLAVTLGERPGPASGLRFPAGAEEEACAEVIRERLRAS
jgi:hypothetical protein